MNKNGVIIIGAGTMGAGIAAVAAAHGHATVLIDTDVEKAQSGVQRAAQNCAQLVDAGMVTEEMAKLASTYLVAATDYHPFLESSWLIIEAAYENVDVKRAIFQELDKEVPEDIIITSNTSGMMLKKIAVDLQHPQRTAITHFWFPGHLVPLVEIVRGAYTNDQVISRLKETFTVWGKAPVVVNKDLPGQLANRILQAIIREAVHIVEMGLATPEDVDTAIKMGMALRFPAWGPLEHIDAVGLDLAYSVQKDVLPGLCNDDHPAEMMESLLKNGNLGFKSRQGFYDWNKKDMTRLAEQRDACIIGLIGLLKTFKTPKAD
jgi:3-hydroxybutyryl-CoA dehydrogenase